MERKLAIQVVELFTGDNRDLDLQTLIEMKS